GLGTDPLERPYGGFVTSSESHRPDDPSSAPESGTNRDDTSGNQTAAPHERPRRPHREPAPRVTGPATGRKRITLPSRGKIGDCAAEHQAQQPAHAGVALRPEQPHSPTRSAPAAGAACLGWTRSQRLP